MGRGGGSVAAPRRLSDAGRTLLTRSDVGTRRLWLCVFKLRKVPHQMRRPDRPRVQVRCVAVQPGLPLDRWVKRSRRAKRREIVDVLYHLMPRRDQPGGQDCPFVLPAQSDAKQAVTKKLRQQLQCDGYTVNDDMTVWHLYAIELKPADTKATAKKSRRVALYVGQTSRGIAERIRQHREGHVNAKGQRLHSSLCHRSFHRPRLDLVPEELQQTLYCKEDALMAEADLRIHLERQGYRVFGGTERLDERRHALGIG